MLLSVITVSFNSVDTIKRCLESIVPFITDEIEYIVYDGKSVDGTHLILNEYSQNEQIKWMRYSDDGIYDAWNKALNYIKKGWIIFLGADDFIIKENFVSLSNMIKGDFLNYDLICSRCTFIDENGNSKFTFGENFDESKIKKYMCVANPSLLYNTSMFDNNRFCTDYKICADYDFLIRKKNLKTFYNPNPITKMTSGGSSNSIPAVIETFKIRAGIIPFYLNLYLSFKAVMILFVNK